MKIERKSLHLELVAALRTMIIEGRFSANKRIPERELCIAFGVSRTPLREALKVLASENLIQIEHNRGAHLHTMTSKQIADLFEVLAGYETVIGTLAAARITDKQLAEVIDLHRQIQEHFEAGRRTEYFQVNQRLHFALADATGNDELAALYRSCSTKILVARYAVNLNKTRWTESMAEHEQMLDALKRRDGAALAAIMHAHSRAIAKGTLHLLAERDDPRSATA